ncbi:Cupredoxin [Rhexocercosporidium sp. MPI-PUGE-AT-0058]|nr:Cupredoxin [Rhexocercosporidium sp. MPI-PUGE-AT-0058]
MKMAFSSQSCFPIHPSCRFRVALMLLFTYLPTVFSKTVTYNWDVSWVNASPDGFSRPVIGINGLWPCPPISVTIGDRVVINLRNNLGNETTSLHFHGLFQTGSNTMDGPAGVTQCPVPPGEKFTYDFVVNQPGTYWYHSHNKAQYIDGFRGAFIVHDPSAPFKYDEEVVLTVSDWYHDQAPGLINYFQSPQNVIDHDGAEPIPNSALMQDAQNSKINVKPGKTYLFRVSNIGSFVGSYLSFEGHEMTIVEVDGVYTEPQKTNQIYLTSAQRYSVLITTKTSMERNFAIQSTLDTDMFDTIPSWAQPDVNGYLVYNSKKPLPVVPPLRDLKPFDDMKLEPKDRQRVLGRVDHQIIMVMDFITDSGVNRAVINNHSYVPQKVPTLYTALSARKQATNPLIYGVNSNSYVLRHNEVVEIVLINHDDGHHPWHLHGHNFQIIDRSPADTEYNPSTVVPYSKTPVRRDVVQVHSSGYVVIRFRADNPGIQLFHCHIEWHVEAGLVATFIEAPEKLQNSLTIPHQHQKICERQGIPTKGNAAGNMKNYTDLTGANTEFEKNNWGALITPPKRILKKAYDFKS